MSTATMTTTRRRKRRTKEQFKVVPARWEDMKKVANFLRSTAHWYQPIVEQKDMSEHAVDNQWAAKNFQRRDFYLGVVEGEAIGTISLQYFNKMAYVGYIYLDAEHVGNGYGQKLMKFAESKAQSKGMKGLALLAHPEATWAKRAYLKYGFEIVASDKADVLAWQNGVLKPYYEEDFELYHFDFPTGQR